MNNREHLIDRRSPVPTYQQIASDIARRISQREWQIDDKLPSEAELSQDYGVSRVTLRQALSTLEKENMIEKFQGKGAFVRANPRQLVQDLTFPSLEPVKSADNPIIPQIVTIQECTAPSHEVRSHLRVTENTPLIYIQRLFLYNSIPVGINNIWIIHSFVKNFSEEIMINKSISKTLYHVYHYNIETIDNYIEPVKLDAEEASLLNSVYDASGLKITSQYLLDTKEIIEYSSTTWLSDYIRFHYVVTK